MSPQKPQTPLPKRALKLRLALYQPDIAPNVGAVIRTTACFGTPLEIIEPCGFVLSDKALKRAAMDYAAQADIRVHPGWEAFLADPARKEGRLILFTTKGSSSLTDFAFRPGDTLLFGRETVGAPEEVHAAAQARLRIPTSARGLPDLVVTWSDREGASLSEVESPRYGAVARQGSGSGRSGNHTDDAWAIVLPGRSRQRDPGRPAGIADIGATACGLLDADRAGLAGTPLLEAA